MADNRYDEAVDILARYAAPTRWTPDGKFIYAGHFPAEVVFAIDERIQALTPRRSTPEEFAAAMDYLRNNPPTKEKHDD